MLGKLVVLFSLIAVALSMQVPGGAVQQNLPLGEQHMNIVKYAMAGLGDAINAAGEFSLVNVNFFATQVVAGINYYMEFIVNHSTEASNTYKICQVKVYERAWENFKQITSASCQ